MRVIMLTWEYPPKIVGGIARHVFDLANALVAQGVKVNVITCEHPGAPAEEVENGVEISRVTVASGAHDFIHWVQLLNDAMYARADRLLSELVPLAGDNVAPLAAGEEDEREPVVIHAHDWLAHYAANGLKHKYRLPLIATIHATEHGRNNGIHSPGQAYINHVEWELQAAAWRVIVCTDYMRRECQRALGTPWDKMDVIVNGVDPSKFANELSEHERAEFRSRYAAPNEKIIFFVGRLVREKGVEVLIQALPKIRWFYNDSKLLICGGGNRDHLVRLAQSLGIDKAVYFAGFVPDDDLLKIYQVADVACFPSLYEPFGIVALEAMAARVPVVVSDTGGLPEVVEHEVTGTTTYTGNANSLADGILDVLLHPIRARQKANTAFERVQNVFNWHRIAQQTAETYARVWEEYLVSDFNPWPVGIEVDEDV
ncbi:MAG: glycosyltransferase family 4 protein [Capsulimonadaceae bacterium]|nr:glycosyltransferase family 4 protein [Capsulimonadaceae bacterium]